MYSLRNTVTRFSQTTLVAHIVHIDLNILSLPSLVGKGAKYGNVHEFVAIQAPDVRAHLRGLLLLFRRPHCGGRSTVRCGSKTFCMSPRTGCLITSPFLKCGPLAWSKPSFAQMGTLSAWPTPSCSASEISRRSSVDDFLVWLIIVCLGIVNITLLVGVAFLISIHCNLGKIPTATRVEAFGVALFYMKALGRSSNM